MKPRMIVRTHVPLLTELENDLGNCMTINMPLLTELSGLAGV
jgi:hypothetical protein